MVKNSNACMCSALIYEVPKNALYTPSLGRIFTISTPETFACLVHLVIMKSPFQSFTLLFSSSLPLMQPRPWSGHTSHTSTHFHIAASPLISSSSQHPARPPVQGAHTFLHPEAERAHGTTQPNVCVRRTCRAGGAEVFDGARAGTALTVGRGGRYVRRGPRRLAAVTAIV